MAARVFLVEDNPLVGKCLTASFEDQGAIVVGQARDEESATAWLDEHPGDWDVMVLDLFLVRGSGLGVLRGLAGKKAEQKIFIASNYITADMRRQCQALGANGVFNKLTQTDELASLLKLLSRNAPQRSPGHHVSV